MWFLLYNFILKLIVFNFRNTILKRRYEVTIESPDGFSVWESLVYKKIDTQNSDEKFKPVVSIYKEGNYIAAGFLEGFNDSSFTNQELELVRTRKVSRALKMDDNKKDEDKLLSKIEHEYFDFETGVVIKFHNSDKLIKHWDEI